MVRQGNITQVSRDHTEVQDLLTSGVITPEEAGTWSGTNAITRAIGVVDLPELEMSSGALDAGDVFVMCTDGLTRHVEDDEILRCVGANMPQQACDHLIRLTLERGAVDNVTVIVVQYSPKRALPDLDASVPEYAMSADDPQEDFLRPRLSPGTRLNGIYEIDHPIGLGGMGEIYKGHLVETGDPVAIKMMLPEMSDQAAFTLFRKEASALHHIQHDAVVRYYVFTVEPVLRRPYLAMEFVEGRTLTDILHDDGPLSFEAVQSLFLRLASGLQAAHEHGIVHRDISPDNIIIPNNDVARAKIIDFGIARTTQHGTVISGGFAGKFNYVSPEQLGSIRRRCNRKIRHLLPGTGASSGAYRQTHRHGR